MECKETLSVIFSNLEKAAEKQQNFEAAAEYGRLSKEWDSAELPEPDIIILRELIASDIASYAVLQEAAETAGDRGAQRALKWGQKVTAIQKSLIDRYASKGEALLEGKNLYICEACGFIYLETEAPELCPVCKAPASRFAGI